MKTFVEYVYIVETRRSFQIHVVKAAINKVELKVNKSASENILIHKHNNIINLKLSTSIGT